MNSTLMKKELLTFIPQHFIDQLIEHSQRIRIFDPVTTLNTFLLQCLEGTSCKAALLNLNILRLTNNLNKISMNTAAYCKARLKLPRKILREIALETGKSIEEGAKPWKWHGREVLLGDGTVTDMEDTKENQKVYPQNSCQGKGLGQPKIRLLGFFALASGSFVDGELGKYSGKGQGEPTLLRKMVNRIKEGSILVLDRFFTNFYTLELLHRKKLDFVVRARDGMASKYLKNKTDKNITIRRSDYKDSFQDNESEMALECLDVRIIKCQIKKEGFRVKEIYIITSLLDKRYKKSDIEELYSKRWGVELDIRNLKITMNLKFLHCKSPEMIEKELWVKLIGYNLVRKITVMTSKLNDSIGPRKRSFKTALMAYVEMIKKSGINLVLEILELLKNEILNSKYRREPRAIKKRNNKYCTMMESREEARKKDYGYGRRRSPKGALGVNGVPMVNA